MITRKMILMKAQMKVMMKLWAEDSKEALVTSLHFHRVRQSLPVLAPRPIPDPWKALQ